MRIFCPWCLHDHNRKVKTLQKSPALAQLRQVDMEEMVKRTFFQTFHAGEHLWNEGEMFDGMRYVPVLLRGEVALLKEVPEDDVGSSSAGTTRDGGRYHYGGHGDGASRASSNHRSANNRSGTSRNSRRESDASAISEEDSESDGEDASIHVGQDDGAPRGGAQHRVDIHRPPLETAPSHRSRVFPRIFGRLVPFFWSGSPIQGQ